MAQVTTLKEGLQNNTGQSNGAFVSDLSLGRRRKSPTNMENGEMSIRTKRRRVQETFQAAIEINGGTKENHHPALDGMVETLDTKFSKKVVASAICKKPALAKTVASKFHSDQCAAYEKTNENMLRSVDVYYAMGVMGKRKYIKVRQSTSFKKVVSKFKKSTRIKVANCKIPVLVPYYKLVQFLEGVDIGNLYSVEEELCKDSQNKVNGFFRDLKEFLPRLAEFYLKVYKPEEFNWFGNPFTFKVAIGGDGAPFGKYDQSCAWLVSFLNVGERFLSNKDNFLIFGANCSESCEAVKKYVAKLVSDIKYLEGRAFKVNGRDIKFEVSELPNDMKMLCFLGGELSNSAKYFSSFANVSYDNMNSLKFTFGLSEGNEWRPWDYETRVKVVKQVEKLKEKLSKSKLTESTKRSKITSFIAEKKSRQEFSPRIGKLINKAHVEPLHLKNNACALMFKHVLLFSIQRSELSQSINEFSKVSNLSPFARLISSLKCQCNMSRLAKKIMRWFDESKGNAKSFDYRFTGQESRRFLHNFMYMISAIEGENDSRQVSMKLHIFAFAILSLRNAISLYSRFSIDEAQINELDRECSNFFICCALYLEVNPTVWTIGNVVPVHTRDIFQKYGKGLLINSMEGREAKHLAISRYATNSTNITRWKSVFRHEFVSLIWLRERGCNLSNSKKCTETYIPKRVSDFAYCYYGLMLTDGKECKYCKHQYRMQIVNSIQQKKVTFRV